MDADYGYDAVIIAGYLGKLFEVWCVEFGKNFIAKQSQQLFVTLLCYVCSC